MAGPPSFEQAVGGLLQQLPEVLPHRLREVGVDLGGTDARMAQQNLNQADVHALLEHVCGKAVAERVWPKLIVEAALASRLIKRGVGGGIRQVGDDASAGEDPGGAAMDFPYLSQHRQHRLGEGQSTLFVAFADQSQEHLVRVDGRDGQCDPLSNA